MKILIYTTHRTGSTSLANFLMFNFNCDYQRFNYFKDNFNNLPNDIIIKLTPLEVDYHNVSNIFDKKIILIREDIRQQSESRVFSEIYGKKFSAYSIPQSFLKEYSSDIDEMCKLIESENNQLRKLQDCLIITYEQLYNSNEGISMMESYFDTKFKFSLENKRYRNMNQNLV